jgi:hypothetical protein
MTNSHRRVALAPLREINDPLRNDFGQGSVRSVRRSRRSVSS